MKISTAWLKVGREFYFFANISIVCLERNGKILLWFIKIEFPLFVAEPILKWSCSEYNFSGHSSKRPILCS